MNREFICTGCPNGCKMTVETEGRTFLNVSGNLCSKGEEFAKNEVEQPKRMLTTTVRIEDGTQPLLPVRTYSPIPKELQLECMAAINSVTIKAPVRMGETVIADLLHTGIDLIATKTVLRKHSA